MALVGEIVRIALHFTFPNAGDCMNVFHALIQGNGVEDSELLTFVAAWAENLWGAEWAAIASESAQLYSVDVDIVNPDGTVDRNIGGESIGLDGEMAGEVESAAVSGYLMAYTEVPKARGSKYIPGIGSLAIDDGAFNATGLVGLAQLLVLYLTDASVGGGTTLQWGLLSKVLAAFVPFISSGVVETLPAYQRRRKQGVGI